MITSSLAHTFVRDRFTWLAYLMLGYFAYMQAALGPLMPFLRAELNLNYTLAGLHLSAFAVGMVLAGLLGDRLAQQWGRQLVFWGGGAGMAVGALGLVWGHQVVLTISSAFFMGWLGTFLLVMIQATLSDRHGEQRAIALTESNVIASICATLAPLFIGGFQRIGFGWQGGLLLGVAVLALIWIFFQKEQIPPGFYQGAETRLSGRSLPFAFWAYWLVICLGVSIEWSMIFWGADFLENQVGFSRVNAATLMSVFFMAMILGRFVGSRLTRALPGSKLVLIAIGITIIGFPLFWLAPLTPLNVIGLFITGLGIANLFPLTLAVAVGVASRQADAASARLSFGGGLAILVAPLVLGGLADRFGIRDAYGLIVLLLVLILVITLLANYLASKQRSLSSR